MIETDVLIIGAGPVGLFQVFELGLLGLKAELVDALSQPGGQCSELYPDKPIYDIPALPMCTGLELTERLQQQISPFNPGYHMGHEVQSVVAEDDAHFRVGCSGELEFRCRAVVIAAGAGSFTPVRLRLEGIDAFEEQQLHYRVRDPQAFKGQRIVLFGGGDSALDWALALADIAASLVVVNRSDRFRAAPASVEKLEGFAARGKARILLGTAQGYGVDQDRLVSIDIKHRDDDSVETLPLDSLLVFFGLSPKLGPIEQWGLELERKAIQVDTSTFATSVPGIYAVGDINTYPGKKKLILSGFHETALAAFAIKERLEPDRKVNLQYTTTSPLMHERLGVGSEGEPGT